MEEVNTWLPCNLMDELQLIGSIYCGDDRLLHKPLRKSLPLWDVTRAEGRSREITRCLTESLEEVYDCSAREDVMCLLYAVIK